jgi:TatD DNase family protein
MTRKKKNIKLPELTDGHVIVDSHCHLDFPDYEEDQKDVINRAVTAGVTRMITIGIDYQTSEAAVALAAKYENVFAAIGIHPHHAAEMSDTDLTSMVKLAQKNKVVAYGEIGIDKVKNYAPLEIQKEKFSRQVDLARELNLPLIIHDREAHEEILAILQQAAPFPARGVIHCFSGNNEIASQFMKLGFYISIPGVVTFNKAEDLQDVARRIPLDSLLVETDAPFLSPVPRRGRRNEPAYVLYTAQKVAGLKGISLNEVASATTANVIKLFHLKK